MINALFDKPVVRTGTAIHTVNNLYVLLDWKRCKETRNTNPYKGIVKKVVVCHHAKEHFPKGSIIYCLMMWSLWMWIMTFKLHTVSLLHVMWLIKYTSAIDNFFYAVVLSCDWMEFNHYGWCIFEIGSLCVYTCTSQSGDDRSFTIASRPPCSKISTLQENSAVEQD